MAARSASEVDHLPTPGTPGEGRTRVFSGGAVCIALLSLLFPACAQFEKIETASTTVKKPQVEVDGPAKLLDKGELSTLATVDFIARVEQLLATGRQSAAQRLLARYPDLALQVLRSTVAKNAGQPALRELAKVYDQQCGVNPQEGWQAVLAEKVSQSQRYAAYEKTRERFQELMNNGEPQAAVALGLRQTLPPSPAAVVEIDACQLAGKAWLLTGATKRATEDLQRALAVGQKHAHAAAYVLLLVSDAERRLEQHDRANEIWGHAVDLAGNLLTQDVPINDPVLWERCSYYRPYPNPWPAEVEQRIQQFLARSGQLPVDTRPVSRERSDHGEYLVWACIGCCHLHRDEPQAALLALKRAEAATKSVRQRDQLQLAEAEAFAQMDQPVAAMALLVQLASRQVPEVAAPALASIGAIKLCDGSGQQALGILRQALEKYPNTNWPRRGEAEANLGLAYLTAGQEEEGIRWLRIAQQRFASSHDTAHLQQSLENEAAYWEHAGKVEQADNVRDRIDELQTVSAPPALNK